MVDKNAKKEWCTPELTALSVNKDTGLGLSLGGDLIIIGTAS